MQAVASHSTWSLGTHVSPGSTAGRTERPLEHCRALGPTGKIRLKRISLRGFVLQKHMPPVPKKSDKPNLLAAASSKVPSPQAPAAPCSLAVGSGRKMKPGWHFYVCHLFFFFLQIFFSSYYFSVLTHGAGRAEALQSQRFA